MGAALARVQTKHSAWTRGELCGELADVLPPSMAVMAPHAAMALALEMVNRVINGEVQPVACLDAPEPKDARTAPALRRDLDGRSVFVRPGSAATPPRSSCHARSSCWSTHSRMVRLV